MLPDEDKTKEQLISELVALRQQVAELEALETERKLAEEALRESESRFSGIAENALEWIWEVDINGEYTYASPVCEKILGYKPEELLGKHFYDLFLPEEREQLKKAALNTFAKKKPFREFINQNMHKNGEIVWLSTSGVPILDERGNLLGYRGADTDITERKRMEEALKASGERYRSLVNNVKLGILRSTPGLPGKVLEVNPAMEEITGYSREELLEMDISKMYVNPEEREAILEEIALAGGAITVELQWRKKDGTEMVVLDTVVAVRDDMGKVLYFDAIIEDITERKRAEEALRESEERYRALVNLGGKVGEAVVMLQDTEQGNAIQTFVSNEWPHITGYSRKELLGMSFLDLLHPKHHEASLKRHKRKMSGEIIPGLFEMSIITKDGTEVPIEVTSAYTTYKGQRANVAFIRDISERKQAEEREKELQQQLYLSSRLASVGELAAGVAHEISNPLTGILGFSERLMRKSTDEEVSRDLEIIHSEAQRVAKVVGNLLTFARRREPKKEYLDINDILQQALELRAYALEASNIEVVTSLASGLPKTMADFHQIQEVFLNIILNAEQAMSEASGGGKLAIKTQRAGDYIRISFADDGPGIPAEHLDKVFDPFFTTRGEKGGTGLGLSLCHGIVAEHAGKIYAKSKPGKGATFFVELPLSPIGASFDHKC